MKPFGVGLAVAVRPDHPWTRRERHPMVIGESTCAAGAVSDCPHRLPLGDSEGSTESAEDQHLHGRTPAGGGQNMYSAADTRAAEED